MLVVEHTIDSTLAVPSKVRMLQAKTTSNKKPVFKDCDNYKPQVKEEQSEGAFVLKVMINISVVI